MPKQVEYQGEEVKIQKPFLKWIGGKTQIMSNIIKYPRIFFIFEH